MATQLRNLLGGAGTSGTNSVYANGSGAGSSNYVLIQERIEEWSVFHRFLENNPEIKEKYEVFKTYEILRK